MNERDKGTIEIIRGAGEEIAQSSGDSVLKALRIAKHMILLFEPK